MIMPDFVEFFRALHGHAPFPWQDRLAQEVLRHGWPDLLDLPTGVGKTSALDIALYCLAVAPDRMPRRTLLVVDRRIVVDQGADHARTMLARLTSANSGPLAAVSAALRSLVRGGQEDAPFAVAVMRGGMPRDNDWAQRPDQPVLGVSTVDQVGSRLLFRGYGVGHRSASIHAGLIGNDTLILLDEVHLAVPFAQTLTAIEQRLRCSMAGLPHRFKVVQMSATPGTTGNPASKTFRLDAEDHAHPVVKQRLSAHKFAELATVKVAGEDEDAKRKALASHLAAAARRLLGESTRVIGIVVNRVDTARHAYALLEQHQEKFDVILVTGRMRALDRDRMVREHLLPCVGAGRDRTATPRSTIVIATQCIEAGADLDFDALVTECASLDALRQRFGRLDRRGELGSSTSVIAIRSDQVSLDHEDPVYGGALAATWQWLGSIASSGTVDMGVAFLPPALDDTGAPRVDLTAPALDAPVLLPAHVDAWAQTTPRPAQDPDVSLWLHGPRESAADIQVVWRHGVTFDGPMSKADEAAIIAHLSACRPSSLESVTVPLAAARRWLAGQVPSAIADVLAGDAEGSDAWDRKGDEAQKAKVVLRWEGDDSEFVSAAELRPGDVVVVDARRGGLNADSFDPHQVVVPVVDLGDLAQLRGRGIASLRMSPEAMRDYGIPGELIAQVPTPVEDEAAADLAERIAAWLALLPGDAPPGFRGTGPEWRAALAAWRNARRPGVVSDGELRLSAPVRRRDLATIPEFSDALTEDDDSSFRAVEVTLRDHSTDVQALASQYALSLGLSSELAEDLALAAWLHDVGKADPRFQRWLVGGSEVRAAALAEPLAKSALPAGNRLQRRVAQERAGYPRGYRHELLSLYMVAGDDTALSTAHDRDLVLHLVASHHGWCRPFAPPIDDPADIAVDLDHGGAALAGSTRHRLARLDSGVSDRFWVLSDRYGWWGLAWLEAILRLADHRASETAAEARR
jgi:CRISPR-associated endonuclease/helicase Cas3